MAIKLGTPRYFYSTGDALKNDREIYYIMNTMDFTLHMDASKVEAIGLWYLQWQKHTATLIRSKGKDLGGNATASSSSVGVIASPPK